MALPLLGKACRKLAIEEVSRPNQDWRQAKRKAQKGYNENLDYITRTRRTPQAGKAITAQALLQMPPKRGRNLCKTISPMYRLQRRSPADQQGTDGQTPADYDWRMKMDSTKLMQKEIDKKDFTHKDADRAFRIWLVTHTDEGGYTSNDYTVHLWNDGSFTISDNDGDAFVSLHGEIAIAFRALLTSAVVDKEESKAKWSARQPA